MTLPQFLGFQHVLPQTFRPIDVERPKGAYDEHGRWQNRGVKKLTIQGSLQTATDEEMVNLEEGRRARGGIVIFTMDELKTVNVKEGTQPDIIPWQDHRYEVKAVDDWEEIAGFYKATAIRMGQ